MGRTAPHRWVARGRWIALALLTRRSGSADPVDAAAPSGAGPTEDPVLADAGPSVASAPPYPAPGEIPTPVLPHLGAVGAGRTIGHAAGAVSARAAAERRFLGADPRAAASRSDGSGPAPMSLPPTERSSGSDEQAAIDPRHPAARHPGPPGPPDDGPADPPDDDRAR